MPGDGPGPGRHLLGARRRRRPGPARGRAGGRDLAAAGPGRPLGRAARRGRHPGRRGDVRGAGRPAARLPHAARELGRQQGDRHADRHAGLARAPGRRGRRPELGVRGPALQRPLRRARGASATSRTSAPWPTWSAGLGADYVLVNPLHAAEPLPPLEPSPYLPVEPALLQPALPPRRGHPGVRRAAAGQARDARPDPGAGAGRARDATRPSSATPRGRPSWPRSSMVHGVERSPERARAFAEFRAREGDALLQFATWSVLAEDHGNDARDWPEELRDMDSQAVADEAVRHVGRIGFAMWLQWVLDEQLRGGPGQGGRRRHAARHHARPRGRRAPRRRGRVADAPRLRGRGPGRRAAGPLQPARPELEPAAVAPGPARRARVRAVPRPDRRRPAARRRGPGRPRHRAVPAVVDPRGRAGGPGHLRALRPRGAGRRAGARGAPGGCRRGRRGPRGRRARRPAATCASAASSAPRSCGSSATAGDRCPRSAGASGAWPRSPRTTCRRPRATSPATTCGSSTGSGCSRATSTTELAAAAAERETWLAEVRRRTGLAEDADVDETVLALHRYLALTPARMLCVALTDAVGDRRTQNQPGTVDEYPNWRVPLAGPDGVPILLEDVVSSGRAAAVAARGAGPVGARPGRVPP